MKSLRKHLVDVESNNILLTEVCNVIAEDMINESFKLPILKQLAAKIKEWETEHRENDKKTAQRYKEEGRSWTPSPTEQSFSSIFGPVIQRSRYGTNERKVRGCKWNELSNDNVTHFDGGWDSSLHKSIRKMWGNKFRGLVIVCDPDSHDIIYVVRGFSSNDRDGKPLKPVTFQFKSWNRSNGTTGKQISTVTTNAYKYSSRNINANEVIELINDYEIYLIEIPDNMISEYDTLVADRQEAQKGVVNYDKQSLDELAKKQRGHYKALAKELRAKRLAENPEYLFNEITDLNNQVIDLYKKISGNYEYADKFYSAGELMSYVSRIFEDYFRYMRDMNSANKSIQHAKDKGKNDEEAKRFGEYYMHNAADYLEGCKKDIEKVKSNIDKIKADMAA